MTFLGSVVVRKDLFKPWTLDYLPAVATVYRPSNAAHLTDATSNCWSSSTESNFRHSLQRTLLVVRVVVAARHQRLRKKQLAQGSLFAQEPFWQKVFGGDGTRGDWMEERYGKLFGPLRPQLRKNAIACGRSKLCALAGYLVGLLDMEGPASAHDSCAGRWC